MNKIVLLAAGLVLLASCKKNKEINADIELTISHMHGTSAFSKNTTYTDDFGNDYQFTEAKFYLSNLDVMDDEMNVIDDRDPYLIVSSDPKLNFKNIALTGNHAHMISLMIGIDNETNLADPTQYETSDHLSNSQGMHWNWNSGYRFIVLEGNVDTDGDNTLDTPFEMHLGTDGFQHEISTMVHADLEDGAVVNINLTVDYSKFFSGINLATDNLTHVMDNPTLANAIKANFASVFTLSK